MSDLLEVLLAGTLRDAPRLTQQAGATAAVATVVVRRSTLTPDGALHTTSLALPITIVGADRAHAFARHAPGSRVVLRGYLEAGNTGQLILIVEHLLHQSPPMSAPEAATAPQPAALPDRPAVAALPAPPPAAPPEPRLRAPWEC